MASDEPPDPTFRVVMVCYANLCRSPMMEFILRQLADSRGLSWQVSSAGVAAREGLPMHRHARTVLGKRGIQPTNWTSSRVDRELLDLADLVLTATEATRDFVLRLHPASLPHTFTLLHFAHLLRDAGDREDLADFGPWLLAYARRMRAYNQPLPIAARDIADPMGRSLTRFRRCGRIVEEAVEIILEPLPGSRWSWRAERT